MSQVKALFLALLHLSCFSFLSSSMFNQVQNGRYLFLFFCTVKFGNAACRRPKGLADGQRSATQDDKKYACALRFGMTFLNLMPDLTIS